MFPSLSYKGEMTAFYDTLWIDVIIVLGWNDISLKDLQTRNTGQHYDAIIH